MRHWHATWFPGWTAPQHTAVTYYLLPVRSPHSYVHRVRACSICFIVFLQIMFTFLTKLHQHRMLLFFKVEEPQHTHPRTHTMDACTHRMSRCRCLHHAHRITYDSLSEKVERLHITFTCLCFLMERRFYLVRWMVAYIRMPL